MSPEIKIIDQVEMAVAEVEGRMPRPVLNIKLPDVSSELVLQGRSVLKVNMDGINGTRQVQHLILSGEIIGGKISLELDNSTGRRIDTLPDGRQIDVYVAKATDQTRKMKQPREKGSRKKTVGGRVIRPYDLGLWDQG